MPFPPSQTTQSISTEGDLPQYGCSVDEMGTRASQIPGCSEGGDCAGGGGEPGQAQREPDIQGGPRRYYVVGPARVNPAIGNLYVELNTPAANEFAPRPQLSYNAKSTDSQHMGFGWTEKFQRWIEEKNATTAEVHTGSGAGLRYTDKDAAGLYTPPCGGRNQLQKNSGWTETFPNGFQMQYNSSGDLVNMENAAGNRWTLSYSGLPPTLDTVEDPFGRVTSYSYDGARKISSIEDHAGRTTQLTVDGNDNLTKHVTPELCTTSLSYDASHRLTGYQDPRGYRHTYAYLCPCQVPDTEFQCPSPQASVASARKGSAMVEWVEFSIGA